jgi:hypothetical protein
MLGISDVPYIVTVPSVGIGGTNTHGTGIGLYLPNTLKPGKDIPYLYIFTAGGGGIRYTPDARVIITPLAQGSTASIFPWNTGDKTFETPAASVCVLIAINKRRQIDSASPICKCDTVFIYL